MPKNSNWHQEIIDIDMATAAISKYASRLIMTGFNLNGWFHWFQQMHPDIFKKYEALSAKIRTGRGENNAKAREKVKERGKQ